MRSTCKMPPEKPYKLVVPSTVLIKLVKERPCLWDKTLPEYKDKVFRESMWMEIYREVEPGFDQHKSVTRKEIGHQITKKWCNIRDAYVKARNNYRQNKSTKPYIHTKILSFLNPFISERQDIVEQVESDDDKSNQWYKETVFVEDEEEVDEKCDDKVDNFNSTTQIETDNIVTLLTRMIEKEEDPDRAFFKSIEPSVKFLSENAKLEFKISVMNLIRDLTMKDKMGIHVALKVNSHGDVLG